MPIPPPVEERPIALLFGGALAFAPATWWSAITPVLALLTIVIGVGVIHHADRSAPLEQPR